MTLEEERLMVEFVWDGNPVVLSQLSQLREQFVRYPEMLKWLVVNKIQGQKLLDFFNDAEGVETRGVIRGVKYILTRIDNDKFNKDALTVKDLK